MADTLSQAEVESLLGTSVGNDETTEVADEAVAINGISSREMVSASEFKQLERINKQQMRSLQTLHEGFSRNFGAALSTLLRTTVEVKLTNVYQLTYREFVFGLENPTCFNLIKAEPLEGQLILDINQSLLFPIIDRLLGGGREASAPLSRPLTELELRLVGRITDLFLWEMRTAWEPVLPLELAVDRVESNPQLAHLIPPNEVVALIGFELGLSNVRGMMNLCIPLKSIERIGSRLCSSKRASYSSHTGEESIQSDHDRLNGEIVEVVVQLAETNLSTADLIALQVGDIIATEQDVERPLTVSIEGHPKFYGSPGAYKGHKAIQVVAPVQDFRIRVEG